MGTTLTWAPSATRRASMATTAASTLPAAKAWSIPARTASAGWRR